MEKSIIYPKRWASLNDLKRMHERMACFNTIKNKDYGNRKEVALKRCGWFVTLPDKIVFIVIEGKPIWFLDN